MKSETLQLQETLNDASITKITAALNAVNGLKKLAVTTASSSIQVDFDETLTSTKEMRTLLKNAGVNVKNAAHGEQDSCCGGCGG